MWKMMRIVKLKWKKEREGECVSWREAGKQEKYDRVKNILK